MFLTLTALPALLGREWSGGPCCPPRTAAWATCHSKAARGARRQIGFLSAAERRTLKLLKGFSFFALEREG